MNILYIYSSNINPILGGVQRVTKVLCDSFRKEGHNCYYLSSQPSDEGIEYQYVFPCSDLLKSINVSFFQNLLKEKCIDVVVNQDGLNKVVTKLVHKSCYGHTKIFTVAHNSLLAPLVNFTIVRYSFFKKLHLAWILPLLNLKLIKKIMNIMYRWKYLQHYQDIITYSNKFVLLSNAFKNELEFFLPEYSQDKVYAIYNPCTVDHNIEIPTEKKKVCLYVGRISFSQKRNDLLLQIWKEIEPKHPDWVLKIVGEGEDLPSLKRMCADMNLKNVLFEGYQSPETYYREASIFCMTSAYEGFGLVLVEAMSYGVVPIAFNSFASAKDVIEDGKDGKLVVPFDIMAYVKHLNNYMADQILYKKSSDNALLKSSFFCINDISKQWINLFNS